MRIVGEIFLFRQRYASQFARKLVRLESQFFRHHIRKMLSNRIGLLLRSGLNHNAYQRFGSRSTQKNTPALPQPFLLSLDHKSRRQLYSV